VSAEHLGDIFIYKRIFVNGRRKCLCSKLSVQQQQPAAYTIKISGLKTYLCAEERIYPVGQKYSFSLSSDFEWISRNKTEEKPPCELN
jgi:hypothetical protein